MRIAVTGGIAEGKSTVLGYLAELGYSTASSDDFAREVFRDSEVQDRLAALLGARAPVSAADLRAALSRSSAVRRSVNRLMHPGVAERIAECPATFVEIPLLIETCLQRAVDAVWVVACGPEEQLRRLVSRYGKNAAIELLESQLRTSVKMPFADVIVRTNQPVDTVKCFVERAAESSL